MHEGSIEEEGLIESSEYEMQTNAAGAHTHLDSAQQSCTV